MKKFLSGILCGIILMTSTIVFAESAQTIEAVFGRIKLVVNGSPVNNETLLYNGTTYVPLRATAEMLGQEVYYDQGTLTAYIGVRPIPAETESTDTAHIGVRDAVQQYSSYGLQIDFGGLDYVIVKANGATIYEGSVAASNGLITVKNDQTYLDKSKLEALLK